MYHGYDEPSTGRGVEVTFSTPKVHPKVESGAQPLQPTTISADGHSILVQNNPGVVNVHNFNISISDSILSNHHPHPAHSTPTNPSLPSVRLSSCPSKLSKPSPPSRFPFPNQSPVKDRKLCPYLRLPPPALDLDDEEDSDYVSPDDLARIERLKAHEDCRHKNQLLRYRFREQFRRITEPKEGEDTDKEGGRKKKWQFVSSALKTVRRWTQSSRESDEEIVSAALVGARRVRDGNGRAAQVPLKSFQKRKWRPELRGFTLLEMRDEADDEGDCIDGGEVPRWSTESGD